MRSIFLLVLGLSPLSAIAAREKPPATYTIPLPPKPDFSSLQWLLGDWTGRTTGRSPGGELHLTVGLDLEGRFMMFHEEILLEATRTAPASKESWMGVLGPGPGNVGFVLRAFSSTGFITRYRVTVEGDEARFNPEGGDQPPPGWLFRRVLVRSGSADLSETVQVAPPNKSFFDYFTAALTRSAPNQTAPKP